MSAFVDVRFDCLPLRSVGRIVIPPDASPAFQMLCEAVRAAIEAHGTHNTYFLHHASCAFHLTNSPQVGLLEFHFSGTVFTDPTDQQTVRTQFEIELAAETCDWLTEPVVEWFKESVRQAVQVEFDRYIAAGDRDRTLERLRKQQEEVERSGGYLGMGL